MKKLLPAILMIAASAALLFMAAGNVARRRGAPRIIKVAVLDRDAIFDRDPVAARLRGMRDRREKLLRGMSAAPFKQGAITPGGVLKDERGLLAEGFSGRGAAYSGIATRRSAEKLQAELDAARAGFDERSEQRYLETAARIDEIFSRPQPPPGEEQKRRKVKLFALGLQYDTLTKDRITSTWNDYDKLRADMDALRGESAAYEKESREAFAAAQLADAGAARADFSASEKAAGRELDEHLKQMLEDMRAETGRDLDTYEKKLELAEAAAAGKRRELHDKISRSGNMSPMPTRGDTGSVSAAIDKYEKNFNELLSRRIDAAALDSGFDLVLGETLYKSKSVPDLTGKF